MEVLCVNDGGRPGDIPISKWIKKGRTYTVINSYKDMNSMLLYELEEIDLKSLGTIYKGFAAYRFAPLGDLDELVEMLTKEKFETV
jgi:hypothetical protein